MHLPVARFADIDIVTVRQLFIVEHLIVSEAETRQFATMPDNVTKHIIQNEILISAQTLAQSRIIIFTESAFDIAFDLANLAAPSGTNWATKTYAATCLL